MRILLATDAWEPQVNGVVRTLRARVVAELEWRWATLVEVISPDQFQTFPLPTYPEIKLAVGAYEKVQERFKSFEPEAIHIATEGPIGLSARRICIEWKLPFTTSYQHALSGVRLGLHLPVRVAVGYAYMKWFHRPSGRLMVFLLATPTLRDELSRHGFRNLSQWSRGSTPSSSIRAGGVAARTCSPASRGRFSSTSAASRWRRTSRPSSSSPTSRAPRWWSATACSSEELSAQHPEVIFAGARFGEGPAPLPPAPARLRSLPRSPTGSACSVLTWRRWPRARRWRPSRLRTVSTSSRLPALESRWRAPGSRSTGLEGGHDRRPEARFARRCAPSPEAVLLGRLRRRVPPQPAALSGAGEEPLLAPACAASPGLRRGPKRAEQAAPPAQPSALAHGLRVSRRGGP